MSETPLPPDRSTETTRISRVPQHKWELHRDEGKYVIRQVTTQVVAVCETREEARWWMIDRNEERKRMVMSI